MAWSKRYVRTSEIKPYDRVTFCGICGLEVYVERLEGWAHPWSPANAEYAAMTHLEEHHPIRYWLWERLRWKWLVRGLS